MDTRLPFSFSIRPIYLRLFVLYVLNHSHISAQFKPYVFRATFVWFLPSTDQHNNFFATCSKVAALYVAVILAQNAYGLIDIQFFSRLA